MLLTTAQLPQPIPILKCKRLINNECILITKFCKFIYWLKVEKDNKLVLQKLQGTAVSSVFEQAQ